MKHLLKNNWRILSLSILAGFFFFVYFFLTITTWNENLKFNSPDETANYFFAKRFAETGKIAYFEPLNLEVGDIIHPRSTQAMDGKIAPTSFLGIILLYGFIAKIFGIWIIPFLTPLLAVIGVLFFYKLIKKIFDKNIAFFSSLLLFFCPVFWYYSEKSMYHNIGFAVFVIIGLYFFSAKNRIVSGLFFGLAIAFRSSEIFLLMLFFLILFFFYKKQINFKQAIFFLAGLILPLFPILYFNSQLYGNPFISGYTANIQSADSGSANIFSIFLKLFFPFGFYPLKALTNFYNYFFQLFWFLAIPSILGFFIFLKTKKTKTQKIYLSLYSLISVWLIFYYGSWQIKDNISASDIIIGNSYVRYWILIYVFALPFFVVFLKKIYNQKRRFFIFAIIAVYSVFSINVAMLSGEESILSVRKNILSYQKTADEVFKTTEKNAIIITAYGDKNFFPQRKIIRSEIDDYFVFEKINKIVDDIPIYYYNNLISEADAEFISDKKIKKYGLRLEKITDGLYKINKLP
ncbi:MAG: glycosyltransferase family 39 protein [Patescibacteria group bacterium]|nr:glycosyltransferase family 39 protein [Patescibacteria group bacterium]